MPSTIEGQQAFDPISGRDAVRRPRRAAAVGVDGDGDADGDRDDATVLPHLDVGAVDPEVGPVALDRAFQEGLHPAIDLLAQPAHLALGDPGHAERLDQVVDRAGRDALDAGLPADAS
jgi:hypothetical protein